MGFRPASVTIPGVGPLVRTITFSEIGVEVSYVLSWRNLGGWPAGSPYRSIGIEPMVGRAADLSVADLADCARIGPDGRHGWHVRLSAFERG